MACTGPPSWFGLAEVVTAYGKSRWVHRAVSHGESMGRNIDALEVTDFRQQTVISPFGGEPIMDPPRKTPYKVGSLPRATYIPTNKFQINPIYSSIEAGTYDIVLVPGPA